MNHFPVLILVGRPASGKSEIIETLQKTDPIKRNQRFHIGQPDILDDFPLLWAWFEEDAILEKILKKPRLHSDEDGYFTHPYLWDLLIERLVLAYQKRLREDPSYHERTTAIIEFSRGAEHGGFRKAFAHLTDLLCQAAILYVQVSFGESLRKNRRRFNPDRPDSILEHSLPDEKLERLYHVDDWGEITSKDPHLIDVAGCRVPYVVFENEDDVTTGTPERLSDRLEMTLDRLWQVHSDITAEGFHNLEINGAEERS